MSSFRTVSSEHVYRGFSAVRVDVLEGPDGRFTREVVKHPAPVAIVALDTEGRVAEEVGLVADGLIGILRARAVLETGTGDAAG